jgi:hypothetical protein
MFPDVISAGDVFAFDPGMSREDAVAFWCGPDKHTYVAEQGGRVLGTYYHRISKLAALTWPMLALWSRRLPVDITLADSWLSIL